jgi:CAAX prenyl protease-like protein
MPHYPNHRLILPYAAPYFAYVGIATLFQGLPNAWDYALRIVVVSALMAWTWRWIVPLTGPKNSAVSIASGVAAGLLGTVLWVAALAPLADPAAPSWTGTSFALRLLAATLLVPVFEELFIRVFLFRIAYQWFNERKQRPHALEAVMNHRSIDAVQPGQWNLFAVVFSTIAFAVGHHVAEWPAALIYGLLMVSLWIVRKDVISCVAAHATTNLTLGIYVYRTQSWGLW